MSTITEAALSTAACIAIAPLLIVPIVALLTPRIKQ